MTFRSFFVLFSVLCAGIIFTGGVTAERVETLSDHSSDHLLIVTTTSVDQTGLIGELEKRFINQSLLKKVEWIVKPTGVALEEGKNCSVDILMVPREEAVEQFSADGFGVNMQDYGKNYYVVVGPESDPAKIRGKSAIEAFKLIAETADSNNTIRFISRGDNSATHALEKIIWKKAGLNYSDINNSLFSPWYISSGSDIGQVLITSSEQQAYTLVNAAVFTTYDANLSLARLVDEGDPDLMNIYSVLMVNPERCPDVAVQASQEWIDLLTSPTTQSFLQDYGKAEFGDPFFIPFRGENTTNR